MCEERATNIYNDVVLEMESALIRVGVAVGAISFYFCEVEAAGWPAGGFKCDPGLMCRQMHRKRWNFSEESREEINTELLPSTPFHLQRRGRKKNIPMMSERGRR